MKTASQLPKRKLTAMDYDKPEAVTVHIDESLGLEPLRESTHSTITPDIEYVDIASLNEHENANEQKDRRGTRLWYA